MSGGESEFDDHQALLRSIVVSTSDADLEGQGPPPDTTTTTVVTPSSARRSGIGDLLKQLDRGLSNRRRHWDRASSPLSNDDRSRDVLGDGAPPEWALLLIGCLLGLATGICVAAFNRGVHVIHEWAWAGTPNEGAAWLRLQRLADTWHRILLIPVTGGVVVGMMHGLLEIFEQIKQARTSQRQGIDLLAAIFPTIKAIQAAVTLGTGCSLGPEGPSVDIGKSCANGCSEMMENNRERRIALGALPSAVPVLYFASFLPWSCSTEVLSQTVRRTIEKLMAEGGEEAAGSPALRIFVGGLGAAVSAADLEDRFSSLGKVHGTELVRSDGRSFAYIDFEPNSEKALAKLFAVYNGCTWKGGKLRLEKAKEHYMTCLKREWNEDARENTQVDTDNKGIVDHLSNSKHLDQEKRHIHIFFPKLGKVKALPMKGTGKHKYSFQRIEVPALPIHFCDCEEHCDASETADKKYTLALNSAAYEKERSIVNNVMERLLGKEHDESPEPGVSKSSARSMDDNDVDSRNQGTQSEDEDDDMDNIVTNIGVRQSDEILMQLIGAEKHLVDEVQESRIHMSEPHKNKLSQKKPRSVEKQKNEVSVSTEVNFNQVTSLTQVENTGEDEFIPASTKNQSSEGMKDKEVLAEVLPDKNPAENISDSVESAASNSWMQKSSWKQLVGESGKRSFSLSHVVSSTNTMVSEPLNAKDHSTTTSLMHKKRKIRSDGESSLPMEAEHKKISAQGVIQMSITPEITSNHAAPPLSNDKIIEVESSIKHDSKDIDEEINLTEASNITSTVKSAVTNTWVQKSSWKELVGESGNSTFSLSQVFSGTSGLAPRPLNAKGSVNTSPMALKNSEVSTPTTTEQVSEPNRTLKPVTIDVVKTSVEHDNDQDMKTKHQEQRRIVPKISIGEVCTFMRSAESEKRWSKAKTALSGYLKKKSRDDNTSKEPNGGVRRKH